MSPIKFADCANCDATINEGQRALYDEQADLYFCDKACHEDWYADNYGNYFRRNCSEVDT
jgi:hypothetical protein